MDEKKLKALVVELAKGLKTEADLNSFSRMLTKLTVETVLNAELADHPGYEKNVPKTGSNTRNGYSSKTVLCDDGEIELNPPRDRENTFEPQLLKKHQTRITQMDSQILSLYAKGMTTREIVATCKEMYDANVSPSLISKVTDAVKEQVTERQNRQPDALYPIVYMDCIVVKVRQNGSVINKAVFLALGINTEGQKELLGMWLAENEGEKFWLSVLTELKTRGVQDILIACVDGLKGFPDAINSVFPQPQISKSWRAHRENLNTLFSYPPDIRKAIYTTNAIESLNCVIRAAIKKRKVFPTDDSVRKVIYLAIKDASKKWSMPIQNWRLAMSRFIIEFGDRLSDHL
ncbi:IS256 family transposase [Salmonella enterica]|nr:IS256 family transposase [Salmonella enterica]EAS0127088.1 IS256 family transposase [Salmonella enterica]EAS0322720.1 IS256 family transposase [Salmonella enterica]EAS1467553.1 IS256 family transposase [Salmonella enterica]EAV7982570.1 IS256 family transposase [Salmonella enterica]